ncbi:MAG TPA: DUF2007 domain-containing protein [Clostridia bacterium]|nr:DUF2007 domain-containing protein [Clostridia bacterium]
MSENSPEAYLLSVGSSMEADMIESLLKANEIPVLRKYRETGGYLMIMMGGTIYGVDLYVPEDLLEKAREIVDASRAASLDEAFPDNIEPDSEMAEAGVEPDQPEGEPEANGESGPQESASEEEPDQQETMSEEAENPQEEPDIQAEGRTIDRRRHRNAWIILIFFIPGFFWMVFVLVKYLYELFAAR